MDDRKPNGGDGEDGGKRDGGDGKDNSMQV